MKFKFFYCFFNRVIHIFNIFSTLYGFPWVSKEITAVLKKLFSSSATLMSSSIMSSFSINFILLPKFFLLKKRGFIVLKNFRLSEISDGLKEHFFFYFYTIYLHNSFASYTLLKTFLLKFSYKSQHNCLSKFFSYIWCIIHIIIQFAIVYSSK